MGEGQGGGGRKLWGEEKGEMGRQFSAEWEAVVLVTFLTSVSHAW